MDRGLKSPLRFFTAWPLGLITLGTLIRLPQLCHGLNEMHSFRQTQTAYVALEYARRGINVIHTPLPVFGPNADVPMEFPLVQAAAAVLIRLGVNSDSAVRIVGLLGFQAAAILLGMLVFRWHGRFTAIVALALYEFSPFGLAWGAAALIEFPAVAASLGMVVGLDSWFRTGTRVGLLTGVVSCWFAFLVKATTPPAWCVLLAVSALTAYLSTRSWGRIVTGFLVGPAIGVALAFAWVRYGDSIKIRNPLTKFLFSGTMHDWNFGSVKQHLNPSTYAPPLLRISTEIAGPIGLGLVLSIAGIVLARKKIERIRRLGWLATAATAPMLFLNLYYVHNYYLIAVFPAIIVAVAIGIVEIAQRAPGKDWLITAILAALVIVGSAAPQDISQWTHNPTTDPLAKELQAVTGPSDLIVGVGCGWNPQTLYFADRRGLMLWEYNNVDVWKHENIDDYHYLFSCEPAVNAKEYLPVGYVLIATSAPRVWRVAKVRGA
ncbi:hypothetical protein [Mycobacterium asiaticum]|nr:hypothetical protein [Mycobacterium asiaticum]